MKMPDKQQLVILCLSAVFALGFGIFHYVPVLREKRVISKEITDQRQLFEQVCSQSALLPELEREQKQLQQALMPFDRKIPHGRHFAKLWQQIADAMNQCNLTEQLVQPGEERKSEQVCSIPLTLECKGSLEQLFAFFEAIENMDRLIRIEEAIFENDSELNAVVKLTAKANVYYQPDNNPADIGGQWSVCRK